MFLPAAFRVDDPACIHAFVRSYPFGILITDAADGVPFGSHIPFLLRAEGGTEELVGHVAKANPHWKSWDGKRPALVIFSGPHGYVSPSWYGEHPAVPTWNYAAVHAYGAPRPLTGGAELWHLLTQQVDTYEAGQERPWRPELPNEYRAKMQAGIVGVRIPVERWEAKFKLSQNRPAADRERVTARLEASSYAAGRELGKFMRDQVDLVYPERRFPDQPPADKGPLLTARRGTIADLD